MSKVSPNRRTLVWNLMPRQLQRSYALAGEDDQPEFVGVYSEHIEVDRQDGYTDSWHWTETPDGPYDFGWVCYDTQPTETEESEEEAAATA